MFLQTIDKLTSTIVVMFMVKVLKQWFHIILKNGN